MSLEVLIWIALAVLLVMGTPIFVSLGMASITVLLLSDIPLSLVMIDLIKVSDMFPPAGGGGLRLRRGAHGTRRHGGPDR
mgnify:FL=1